MDKTTQSVSIRIPDRIVSSVDLSRSLREVKALDDWLHQAALRTPGQAVQTPKTSQTLEDIASINGISLLDQTQRTALMEVLDNLKKTAPRVHMSFAVEPSAQFRINMITWLRANVHPFILLDSGLQPTLAAGCMLRTTNKMIDMSLRHRFKENRHFLVEKIAAFPETVAKPAPASPEAPVVAPAQTAPVTSASVQTVAPPSPTPANPNAQTIPVKVEEAK